MNENEIYSYFGIIPVYFNVETNEIRGANKFYNLLLNIYFWIEIKLGEYEIDENDSQPL